MTAGGLSPAELPFGARVHAVFTKYDGAPHWEYDLVVVGVDEHGVWVGGAPGGHIARPGLEFVSDAHWVTLYPHDGWWVATFNDSAGTFSSRIYVDVTTQSTWWHRPDGVLSVSAVDLDLDVIRRFTGELLIDDEDEFEQHRDEMGYPDSVVNGARQAADRLVDRMGRRAEPFEDVAEGWLTVCREYVVSDERGRAVLGTDPAGTGPIRTPSPSPPPSPSSLFSTSSPDRSAPLDAGAAGVERSHDRDDDHGPDFLFEDSRFHDPRFRDAPGVQTSGHAPAEADLGGAHRVGLGEREEAGGNANDRDDDGRDGGRLLDAGLEDAGDDAGAEVAFDDEDDLVAPGLDAESAQVALQASSSPGPAQGGSGEEDLLAVWSDELGDQPLIDGAAEGDDGPVIEVEHHAERTAPAEARRGEAGGRGHHDDGVVRGDDVTRDVDVARDLEDADDIDTSPVDPAEVAGVLLTTESGRTAPLWFDGHEVEPEDLDLSPELSDHLRDWADRWNRDFDPVRGWHPRAVIADYEALGRWLGRRVKDEVGGLAVTVQLAHLGRSSLETVPPAPDREPAAVALDPDAPGDLPVRGDVVTETGTVGCFSSEVNERLRQWREFGGRDAEEAARLRALMAAELGPDYAVA